MSFIEMIDNEYIFQLVFFYRKTIPSKKYFYMIIFLVKFFPLILLTHQIDPKTPSNLFTLAKVIKALTIINNIKVSSYPVLCIIVYIIISVPVGIFIYVFGSYYSASKITDYKLYGVPVNLIQVKKIMDTIKVVGIVWFLIVIFLYQHLIEVLFFGIFRIYSGIDFEKNDSKINANYFGEYIFAGINIFFSLLLIVYFYFFMYLSSTSTIICNFGYHSGETFVSLLLNIIYSSLQGLYTSSFCYDLSSKKSFNLILCNVLLVLLLIDFLYTISNNENYFSGSTIPLFISFIKCSCLFSSIFEISLYYCISEEQRLRQRYYFLKIIMVVLNGAFITLLIRVIKRRLAIKHLSKYLFNSTKAYYIDEVIRFYIELNKRELMRDKLLLIFHLLHEHQIKCRLKTCRCNYFKELYDKINSKETNDKILKKFISLGETKIEEAIMNHSENKKELIDKLLFNHCDFLFSLRKRYPVVLYLCQYYLLKKQKELKFKFAYFIYEINYFTFHELTTTENQEIAFLNDHYFNVKTSKLISLVTSKIEKVFYLKALINTNSKISIKCEEILQPLRDYIQANKSLLEMIKKFATKTHFDHSTKLKYLMYYYLKLFNTSISKKFISQLYDGKKTFPTFQDIYDGFVKNNTLVPQFIIMNLDSDNEFIVNYISTVLAEHLEFTVDEIKGKNISENILPRRIGKHHSIYMKEFTLLGNSTWIKESFVLNKKHQMVPAKVYCKSILSINNLFSIFVKVDEVDSRGINRYDLLLDPSFNIIYISESFEEQFFFSLKMLKLLKINFCDFFGLNREELIEYFSNTKPRSRIKANSIPLAATSYRQDEVSMFQTLNFRLNGNDYPTKDLVVYKEEVENYIFVLTKNIEDLCLEKEWKFLINVLYEKIKKKLGSDINIGKQKITVDNDFHIRLEFKEIGPYKYYSTIITEEIDDESKMNILQKKTLSKGFMAFGDDLNGAIKSGNLINYIDLHSPTGNRSTQQINGNIFRTTSNSIKFTNKAQTVSNKSSITLNFITNNKNNENSVTINNSTTNFLNTSSSKEVEFMKLNSNLTKKNQSPRKKMKKVRIPKEELKNQEKKEKNYINILRSFQTIILFIIIIITVINLRYNFLYINQSLKIYKSNIYSYLLLNDLLFGSLVCIKACFVQDKMEAGNMTYFGYLLDKSSTNIITHYHKMNSNLADIVKFRGLEKIYFLLNREDEYHSALPNWNNKIYNSTLIEEIYLMHRSIKGIISTGSWKESQCRMSEYFINEKYLDYVGVNDTSLYATVEERAIYYIIKNVLTTITKKMETINIELSELFEKNNKNSNYIYIGLNFGSFGFICLLYLLIFLSIKSGRSRFRKRFKQLLSEHEQDKIFYEDLLKFKRLSQSFSQKAANEYTEFKNKINFIEKKDLQNGGNLFERSQTVAGRKDGRSSSPRKCPSPSRNAASPRKDPRKNKPAQVFVRARKRKNFKSEPLFFFVAFYGMISALLVSVALEIANIYINHMFYQFFSYSEVFGSLFLWRFPKLNQLFLYTYVSGILNDPFYILSDEMKRSNAVFCNFYGIEVNYEENSFYQVFGNSEFSFLIHQLSIIGQNIDKFVSDNSRKKSLFRTVKKEILFNTKGELCHNVNYYYSTEVAPIESDDYKEFFTALSQSNEICRKVGNNINESGLKEVFNFMRLQTMNIYTTFIKSSKLNRNLAMFSSSDLQLIIENNSKVFQKLYMSSSSLIIYDIKKLISSDKNLKIIISIVNIILSCCVITIVLWIALERLEQFNKILKKMFYFLSNFNKIS